MDKLYNIKSCMSGCLVLYPLHCKMRSLHVEVTGQWELPERKIR